MPLSSQDQVLIQSAREIIRKRYKENFHEVGAALRTRSGRVFSAVHLEAYIGRIAVCAEAIAIGMAAAEGDTDLEAIVAVNSRGQIVSPCGMCREMISDYAPDCQVILSEEEILPVAELLPRKYFR
jgi:cytidine deaminase